MRLIRNVTFVVFLATFSWSIETGAFASSWQSWALEFDCSLQEDYPSQNQLSGTCNCDDPVEGCINVEHFCDNFAENACDDYCFQNTCGIADVTDCLVNSPLAYVECSCDLCPES